MVLTVCQSISALSLRELSHIKPCLRRRRAPAKLPHALCRSPGRRFLPPEHWNHRFSEKAVRNTSCGLRCHQLPTPIHKARDDRRTDQKCLLIVLKSRLESYEGFLKVLRKNRLRDEAGGFEEKFSSDPKVAISNKAGGRPFFNQPPS